MSKKRIIFAVIAILLFAIVSYFYMGISSTSENEIEAVRSTLQEKLDPSNK